MAPQGGSTTAITLTADNNQVFQGPPYAPLSWTAGGPPVKRVDVPVQTVFMLLFLIGAIVHMKIYQGNRTRGHKFLPNLFIFFFCISRILTSVLRIASVSLPQDIRLTLAAQIFVAASVLILFILNLIFAMRIVRSTHRAFGWHPAFGLVFNILFLVISATLIILITTAVQSFYTLDPQIRATDRSLQLYGSILVAIVATLPLPMVILTLLIPYSPLDEFGTGRTRIKVTTLLVSTTLLSIGAWYRCGIAWQTPVARTQPLPRYLGKAPFYILNFLFEFQTVIMYAILCVDQCYYIPNGAKGPGSYSRAQRLADMEMQDSRPNSADESTVKTSTFIHKDTDTNSDLENDIEKASELPTIPQTTLSPRQPFQRHSLMHAVLTKAPSLSQKCQWRASEESRIIRRLGGPWKQITSPTDSTLNSIQTAPSGSTFRYSGQSVGTTVAAPRIRDTLHEDWTPQIEWELASPRRFLSLKKRSLSMLT